MLIADAASVVHRLPWRGLPLIASGSDSWTMKQAQRFTAAVIGATRRSTT